MIICNMFKLMRYSVFWLLSLPKSIFLNYKYSTNSLIWICELHLNYITHIYNRNMRYRKMRSKWYAKIVVTTYGWKIEHNLTIIDQFPRSFHKFKSFYGNMVGAVLLFGKDLNYSFNLYLFQTKALGTRQLT